MTDTQRTALQKLCERYSVLFDETNYRPQFDLPTGYVAGWVGPLYVGCGPGGDIHT